MQKCTGAEGKVLQKMPPLQNQTAKNILNIFPQRVLIIKKTKNRKIQ
jgi:hypothetical protein